jgi:hypothetical protein
MALQHVSGLLGVYRRVSGKPTEMKLTVTHTGTTSLTMKDSNGRLMVIALSRDILLPYDGYILSYTQKCGHTVLEGKKAGAKGPCRRVMC